MGTGQPDPLKAEALERLRSSLPASGAVHAFYTATKGFGEVLIGLDLASGAWYFISGASVMGRDTQGQTFAGIPRRGSVEPAELPAHGADCSLDPFLPAAMARDLVARPELIQRVDPLPHDGLRITITSRFVRPRMPRETAPPPPATQWIDIDAAGQITAIAYEADQVGADDRRFQYNEAGPVGFRLVIQPPGYPVRLASFSYSSDADPAAFSLPRVESLAADSVVNVTEQMARSTSQARPPPGPTPPLARFRWPLLATGVVVLLVGVLALWRRTRHA